MNTHAFYVIIQITDLLLLFSCCHVRLFETPRTVAHQAPLSFTISQSLLKFMSIASVLLANHLILCCSLFLLPSGFSSIRVFSSELALHIRWPQYWIFSFIISPSSEYSGLISFKIDWFVTLQFKGLSRVISNKKCLIVGGLALL